MKNIVSKTLLLLVFVMTTGTIVAQDVPTRDKINDKYKWNLADLYKSEADFEKDFAVVSQSINQYAKHKGKVVASAKNLLTATDDYQELWKGFMKLYMYASLLADQDVSIGKNQILRTRVSKLGSDIEAGTSFYSPELLAVDFSKIGQFIDEENGLKTYAFFLQERFRMKPHTLSAEAEEAIANMGPIISIPNKVYGILNDAELQLPSITGPDGDMIKVSHGRYRSALYHPDRDYRRNVYKGIYEGYQKNINTFEALFNGRVASRVALAKIRKFPSALESAVYENNIPVSVFENLVKTAQDNVNTLHRWGEIKRKALKLDKIRPYDTYITLFEEEPKTYTYEEGVNMVREALRPLGEEYIKAFDLSINNRWIDVYETKNKRSGAYSNAGVYGVHPWILLNWGGTLDDVFVLAHEVGHNMHSYFTEQTQPFHYYDYSIFVAEVASTTNEALLLEYLIKNAKSDKEKASLLEKFLVNAQATFFRQTRFAEFEKMIHEKAEKGEYLSADELSKLFGERYQFYWGDAMETDTEEGLSWARVHHLTQYNFYVYQYSTGFAAAQALAEGITKEGKPAIDRYISFLRAGSSDTPINVLRKAGVDMSSPEPIKQTITKMNRYMDELEKLMK
ncbi:MAG: oligoendopeptidase F [Bacteroidetes bacterium]|nr:oligoendopeptidase F [Bacteroidota bacterium]